MRSLFGRLIPLFIFITLGILFFRGLALDPHRLPSAQIGKPLPAFELPALSGTPFNSSVMHGHVSLLNVWASWCMACADEQVVLMKLSNQGIAIYGLNYKDTPEEAKKWLEEWGNPYQSIGEDPDGRVAIRLGVYGSPETYLIDKNGIIRYRHVGSMTMSVWEKEFLPLIKLFG